MGQLLSNTATAQQADAQEPLIQEGQSSDSASRNRSNPAVVSSIAEAAPFSYGRDQNESAQANAWRALHCPCLAHLRSGPCGSHFSNAFLCFLMSTAEEKGADCVDQFSALQECVKMDPDAFVTDHSDKDKEVANPVQEMTISPPMWSVKSGN